MLARLYVQMDRFIYVPPWKLALEIFALSAILTIAFFPIHHKGIEVIAAAIILCFALTVLLTS